MPRIKKIQSDVGDTEAPEAMAEALMEVQAEKKNGGKEVELGKPKRLKTPVGGTTGNYSGGMHGGFHAKRAKY